MRKNKLLLLLVLLVAVVSGAMAQTQEPAKTYNITLDEGTGNKDSQNWEITPKSSELGGGETVTVTYNGSREVKSVTVVKKAAGNPYLKWDANQKKLVATPMPATVTKVQNSDQDVEWAAGTYVVEGEVTINGTISLNGNVDLIIKDGAKLTANKINGNSNNLSIYGQAQMTGELVVNSSITDAIYNITTLEVHSAKVTATSPEEYCGGFCDIGTFNVYGGSVYAEKTGTSVGFGINLVNGDSMNIYGGDVTAIGKGTDDYSYGITGSVPVTVYGGKLWAKCAENRALGSSVTLTKGAGFSGKIEYSSNGESWTEYTTTGTPSSKYVRVGY